MRCALSYRRFVIWLLHSRRRGGPAGHALYITPCEPVRLLFRLRERDVGVDAALCCVDASSSVALPPLRSFTVNPGNALRLR